MGKLKLLIMATALIVSVPGLAVALQTNSLESTKTVNQDTAIQIREAGSAAAVEGVTNLMSRYMTNFRTCEPIHLSQSVDVFGFKMDYRFDINGWVDNKCSYYMTGNIGGLGNDIREVFNVKVSDEKIAKIKPVVQCNFNREELNILVDGFVAAQERKISERMGAQSADASASSKPKMSPAEEKMMQMLMGGQVCTVPNQEELMKNFSELMEEVAPSASSGSGCKKAPEASTPRVPELEDDFEYEQEKPILREKDGPKVNYPQAPQF